MSILAATRCRTWKRSWPLSGTLATSCCRCDLWRHRLAHPALRRDCLPAQGRTLLCKKGEEHRIHRAEAVEPKGVQQHVGRLRVPLAHELIDAFGARRKLDLVAEYCHRYPLRVIARFLDNPGEK